MAVIYRHDINIALGEDFEVIFEFPYDITGFTFTSKLRDSADELADEFTCTVVNAKDMRMTMTYTDTILLNVNKKYRYDIKQIDLSGKISYPVKGFANIVKTMTRELV